MTRLLILTTLTERLIIQMMVKLLTQQRQKILTKIILTKIILTGMALTGMAMVE